MVFSLVAMGLIDTHTHLDSFAKRGELPAILQRARDAGLEKMIAIGTEVDDWTIYRDLAQAHRDVIYYTVGLHPCSVGEDWQSRVAQLGAFWQETDSPLAWQSGSSLRPVALGEIGLDRFHLPKEPDQAQRVLGWQMAAFVEQLALAKRLDCPVVVHSRGAFKECIELIDASGVAWPKVVFHCFTEGPLEIAELIKRGGFSSFTGVITYKNADNVRAAALAQGLERLMIETDAPYLTPVPHRGKPNEPAFLRHTAEFTADVFGVGYERLAEVTTANAKRFFRI